MSDKRPADLAAIASIAASVVQIYGLLSELRYAIPQERAAFYDEQMKKLSARLDDVLATLEKALADG